MSRAPSSFSESLKRDVERRLRAAIRKLGDRAVDIEIENAQAYQRGDAASSVREQVDLESHIWELRRAIASVVAWGKLVLCPEAEAALRVAEEPRRRPHACAGGCAGHDHAPTKPKASQALERRAKPAPKPKPKTYKVNVPAHPPEEDWEHRALSALPRRAAQAPSSAKPVVPPELTLERFNRSAHVVALPQPANAPRALSTRSAAAAPALQEPLFGRPLMLPAYVPGKDE